MLIVVIAFFDRLFPIYPFLDRVQFENVAFGPQLEETLSQNIAWGVLYYAVLALGLLHEHGGSFTPFEGKAWQLFTIALKQFTTMLLSPNSLTVAQVGSIHHLLEQN